MKEKLAELVAEFKKAEKNLRSYESHEQLGQAVKEVGRLIGELEKLSE